MAYTLEQVREARKRALAAGDTAAAEKLGRFAVHLAMQQQQEKPDPTEGMSVGEKLLAGVGQGMVNVGRHVGNLVGLVSDEDLAEAKRLDSALLNTGAGRFGSLIGETAALPVPMMGATAGLARLGGAAAKAVGGAVRRGAVEGAAQGAIMADPDERLEGAFRGAAFGSVIPAAGAAVSKAVRGVTRTPEAQMLLDRGVDLTPGQMNPRGIMNQLEEGWQSVPIVGPVISSARDNARQSFQRSVVREGAMPGAAIPDGDIDQMLSAAYRSFEPMYEQAKGFPVRPVVMTSTGKDIPLLQLFRSAANSKSVRATDETRKSVAKWLQNQITQHDGTSDGLLAMRSQIRAEARKARMSADADERAAADLLEQAERAVTDALESQLPPQAMAALRAADAKYGTYKVIEDAVAAAKDAPGGFTPHQLSTAIKAVTEKGAYARGGGGPLRELASAGREVFDVRSPPTGQRLAAIALPGAVGLSNPMLGIPAAAGFLGLVGTRTGRALAAGRTRPQLLAQALSQQMQQTLPPPVRAAAERYARALLAAETNE